MLHVTEASMQYLSTDERRIAVDHPFAPEYSKATVVWSVDKGRRSVILYGPNTLKRQVYYATYLFRVNYFKQHGCDIPDGMEVDHIDNDKTNDTIENLQLLTRQQNNLKHLALRSERMYLTVCAACGRRHLIRAGNYDSVHNLRRQNQWIHCTGRCRAYTMVFRSKISDEFLRWVSQHQVLAELTLYGHRVEEYHGNNYPRCMLPDDYFDQIQPFFKYKHVDAIREILPEHLAVQIVKTPEERIVHIVRAIQACLDSGESPYKAQETTGESEKVIFNFIRRYFPDWTPPPTTWSYITQGHISQMIDLRKQGDTFDEISVRLNIPRKIISKYLQELGFHGRANSPNFPISY